MAVNWDEFDKKVDHEALNEDVKNAASGNGQFEDTPLGEYEVKIVKLELTQSKKGSPMGVCWFEILAGPHKKAKIFYYQVVDSGFKIDIFNKFLRSLDSGVDVIWNKSYKDYANMILDVAEAIENAGLEYALKYDETDKGFKTYEITDVFTD